MAKLRTYVPRYASPRMPYISEAEVYERVKTAVRTFRALPSGMGQGVRSSWPREYDFHAEAIRLAMTPGVPVDNKKIEKAIKKLRAKDFDDIHLGETTSNMPGREFSEPPTRKQISDCMVAGEWFTKLSRLPENIDQFLRRVEEMRIGKRSVAQVDDQIFVARHSMGFSISMVGIGFGMSDKQAETKHNQIARDLFKIANGTARILKPGDVGWDTATRGAELERVG